MGDVEVVIEAWHIGPDGNPDVHVMMAMADFSDAELSERRAEWDDFSDRLAKSMREPGQEGVTVDEAKEEWERERERCARLVDDLRALLSPLGDAIVDTSLEGLSEDIRSGKDQP